MSEWQRATWRTDSAMYLDTERGRFFVMRHGEGRKYWGVQHPDGTYTHSALTQAEAKRQAEAWEPDATLTTLVDAPPAAAAAEARDVDTPSSTVDGLRVLVELVDVIVRKARERGESNPTGRGYGYQATGNTQQGALEAIRDLVALRGVVERAINAQVAVARHNSGRSWYSNAATWSDIGEALGVSKQGAQAKYGKTA